MLPSRNGLFGPSRRQSARSLVRRLQVASAETFDFLGIGQKSSFPDGEPGSTGNYRPNRDPPRRGGTERAQCVKKYPHLRIGNRVLPRNHFRMEIF
ncbi:hypothetical protein TRIP_B200041 [uncultured Desulfatiglans sp.]|nr:hypothetical protein TRIP_B200041 [uncultured Desulfatiglans sp.]